MYRNVLPLHLIWTGFVANSAIYASVLWVFIPGPFVIRRAFRHHRGRCVACGYDLRGAEHDRCPECGGAIAGVAAE